MDMPIEKMVALLIVLIVLVALLIFSDIIPTQGKPINAKTRMYTCCSKFLSQGCKESVTVWCDEETTIDALRIDADMSWDNVKSFCNCP